MTVEKILMPDGSAPITAGTDDQLPQKPDHVWYGIFQRLVESHNALADATGDNETGLGTKASATQTEGLSGIVLFADTATEALRFYWPYDDCTGIDVLTSCLTGTATFTFSANASNFPGSPNAVSTTPQAQAHTGLTLRKNDLIRLQISSGVSCENAAFMIRYTRTLAGGA